MSAVAWDGWCAALGSAPGGSAGTPPTSPWCVERGVLGHLAQRGASRDRLPSLGPVANQSRSATFLPVGHPGNLSFPERLRPWAS